MQMLHLSKKINSWCYRHETGASVGKCEMTWIMARSHRTNCCFSAPAAFVFWIQGDLHMHMQIRLSQRFELSLKTSGKRMQSRKVFEPLARKTSSRKVDGGENGLIYFSSSEFFLHWHFLGLIKNRNFDAQKLFLLCHDLEPNTTGIV